MSGAAGEGRSTSPTAKVVKKEFEDYWRTAEKSRLANAAQARAVIAAAHKYAKCFLFLTRPFKLFEPHRRVFLQELTSDTIHLVHALTGGDARGARFYLRSVIENFWRHHYFRDHIVEYGWLHTRDKYFLEMKNLREHCSWLDCFQNGVKPLMTNLPRLYAALSTSVHSSDSTTLALRETLEDIRLLEAQGKAIGKDLLDTLKVCLTLVIVSEYEVFLGLHVNIQAYLLGALSATQRRVVQAAFPVEDAP